MNSELWQHMYAQSKPSIYKAFREPWHYMAGMARGHASLWYRLYESHTVGRTGMLRSHLVEFSTDGHADENLNGVRCLQGFCTGPFKTWLHTKTQMAPMKNHPTFHHYPFHFSFFSQPVQMDSLPIKKPFCCYWKACEWWNCSKG